MAKATYLLRKAGELVKEKRYQDAVEVYLQATETDPADARAWFGLGVCLYRIDNLEVAHIALERAQKMGYPRAEEALSRVEAAEKRRSADGTGAKGTVAPTEAKRRAATRPAQQQKPPRPAVRAEDQKISVDRYLRVMLIENIQSDREAIIEAVHGTIKDCEVSAVEFDISTSQTMSGTVHYDAAIIDWDTAPNAAAGLIQILRIKRPTLMVICLTERWDPETAVEILEVGADYHLVKGPHFASTIPLVLAQWVRRDKAVAHAREGAESDAPEVWSEAVAALDVPLMVVSADLTVTHANQAAMKHFRRGEDEFIGRTYGTLFHGQEEPPETCPVLRALEKGEAAEQALRFTGADKETTVRAWPVPTYAGKIGSAIVALAGSSEQQAAPDDLTAREWLYRNLTERANAGVAMVGPDGKVAYANDGLCAMLDQTEQELLDQPIEGIVPPQEQESLRECLQTAVEQGRSADRLDLQRSDGSTAPAEVRLARFASQDGTYLVLTAIGVTDLERAEHEMLTETNKLSSVLDDGVDRLECGLAVLDGEGRVTWANALAAELLGTPKKDLIGADYLAVAQERLADHIEGGADFVARLRDAHESAQTVQDWPLRLAGDLEVVAYWSTPVESSGGSVGRIEHFYPLGSHAAAPLQVPADHEALASIAATVPDMLFMADKGGKITWCSPAARQATGRPDTELCGTDLADLAVPDDRTKLEALVAKAVEWSGQVQKEEFALAGSNGCKHWGEVTVLADPTGGAIQGALRDVTDHHITEAVRAIVMTGETPV